AGAGQAGGRAAVVRAAVLAQGARGALIGARRNSAAVRARRASERCGFRRAPRHVRHMKPPVSVTPDERLHAALRTVLPAGTDLGPDTQPAAASWDAARRALACDDAALADRIARHFGLGVAVVGPPDASLKRLVPEALARRLGVVPLR